MTAATKTALATCCRLLFVAALVGAAVGVTYHLAHRGDKPAPADALAKVAKDYGSGLQKAKANGWRAGAAALRGGASVADAQVADQAAFKASRESDFERVVRPQLDALLPEGADAITPEMRVQLAAAFEKMANAIDPPKAEPVRGPPSLLGRFGWADEGSARSKLVATLPHRTLALAAPGMVTAEPPDAVYLYKAWKEVLGDYPAYPAQEIGDCTSFGSGHAVDLLQCIDLALNHGTKDQFRETSTEIIYGLGREIAGMLGRGDGCYGVAVAKALTDAGALPREKVGPYSGARAKQYGRSGVPADFKTLAATHKLGAATLVTTVDEASAALANGYPFIVCSNQGFTTVRDRDGVCEAKGVWPHCMFVAGYRHQAGELQFLVCQSWGPKMPTGPVADDQPPFSFWVRAKVMARMLAAQDSLAFSRFAGFVPRPVPDRWTYSGFAKPGVPKDEAVKVERKPLKDAA